MIRGEPIPVQAIYEPRPCEVCSRAIAAAQLYVMATADHGPRHVACQPPSRLDVQRLVQAARTR
jgi:hypothetical protein